MIINLSSIAVTEIKEQDDDYHVYATLKAEPRFCLGCGSDGFYGQCKNCGKTTTQECTDISDKHRATNRL